MTDIMPSEAVETSDVAKKALEPDVALPSISVTPSEDPSSVVESFLLREAAAREWIGAVLNAEGHAGELPAAEALESLCADGSLLCKLMECCFPKSIPVIHEADHLETLAAPRRAILEKENFMFFLEACQQCAHIPPGDLCSMQDLISRDPAQVLATIEAVGEAAVSTGYRGPLLHRVAESPIVLAARAKKKKKRKKRKRRLLAEEVVNLGPPASLPSPSAVEPVPSPCEAPDNEPSEAEETTTEDDDAPLSEEVAAAIAQVQVENAEDGREEETRPLVAIEDSGAEKAEKEKAAVWVPQKRPEVGQMRKDMLSRKLRQSRLERKRSTRILGTPWDRQQSMAKLSIRLSAPIDVGFRVTANQRVLAEPGITRFQAIVRGRMARALYRKIRRNEAYRANVANEILATEQSYVDNLKMLVNVFLDPLLENQAELSLQRISGQVQVIIGYSELLLGKVEERVNAWDHRQRLADVFVELANYLKVYTQYVKDYSVLAPKITAARKVPAFKEAIRECEKKKEAKKMMLESLLIMPVQRIPRYQMLIEDLLKHTKESHPDFKNLGNAAVKIKEVAIYVNERAEEYDNLRKVLAIQHSFTGKAILSLPHRRFVDESPILAGPRKELSKMFLFNDILIIGVFSEKLSAYRLRRRIPLERIGVEDIPDDDDHQNCFWVLEEKHTPLLLSCLASKKGRLSKKRKAKWLTVVETTKVAWLASQAEFSKVRESTERAATLRRDTIGRRGKKKEEQSEESAAKFKEGLTKALDSPNTAWGAGQMPSSLFSVLQEEMAKKREQDQRVMVDVEVVGTMDADTRKKLIPLISKADGDSAKFVELASSEKEMSVASVILTPEAANEKRKSKALKAASPRSSDNAQAVSSKKSKGLKGTIRRKTTNLTRAIPLFSGGKGSGGSQTEDSSAPPSPSIDDTDEDLVVDDTPSNFERFMALVGTGADPLSDPLMQRSPRKNRRAGRPQAEGGSQSEIRYRPMSASVGGGSLGQASLDALLSPRDRPVPPPRPDRPHRSESDGRRLSLAPRPSASSAFNSLMSPRYEACATGSSLPQVSRRQKRIVPDLSLSTQALQTATEADSPPHGSVSSSNVDAYDNGLKRATVSAAELRMAAAEAQQYQPPRSPRSSMRLTPNGSRRPPVPPRSPRSLAGTPPPQNGRQQPTGTPHKGAGSPRNAPGGSPRQTQQCSPVLGPGGSPRRNQAGSPNRGMGGPRLSPNGNRQGNLRPSGNASHRGMPPGRGRGYRRSMIVNPTESSPSSPDEQPPPRPPRSFPLTSSS